MKFRGKCRNTKLRHVFFRVVSGDIFSKERMFRFGRVDNNRCERCEQVETTKHLLWECAESKNIWELFNEWLRRSALRLGNINEYKDIFWIKVKIIQEIIQIQHSRGWNIENTVSSSRSISKNEAYNQAIKNK